MAIDLERYNKLKKQLDEAQTGADRAQGAFDQVMARLKEEHGCEDIAAAKRLVKKLEAEAAAAEEEFNAELAKFEEEWAETLAAE